MSDPAHAGLLRYPWPGNVRELANLMERLALLDADGEISASALGLPEAHAPEPAAPVEEGGASLDDAVRDRLVAGVRRTAGDISRSAAPVRDSLETPSA